jgi:UDP-N-acetylmuramoyl-tripeptide--D-alanyl-D-alanine ligase
MITSLMLSQIETFTRASLNAQLLQGDVSFTRVTTDTRQVQTGDLFVALRGERFDAHNFLTEAAAKGACGLVVEKYHAEIQLPQLVVKDTLLALGQIAAFNRNAFNCPLIAITGSSGKTTVKTMLAGILRECGEVLATQGNLNNHIGVPLTLLQLEAQHRYAVIEMGASGMGEIAYLCELAKPDIAMINNVMPAHIAGFGSIENVAKAKGEIYGGLSASGIAIVNVDENYASQWLAQLDNKKVIRVSLHDHQADCYAQAIRLATDSVSFTLVIQQQAIAVQLNTLGEHSVRNALAAAACAFAAGANLEQIQRGLANFSPVSGRMTRHPGYAGSLVIDDSYNANPGSVRAAIDVLAAQPHHTVLVLGDMAELGEDAEQLHADVGAYARARGIKHLFSVGQLSRHASIAFAEGAQHFSQQDELIAALKSIATSETLFLIKGSRSAKTDLIVRALCDSLTSTGDQH